MKEDLFRFHQQRLQHASNIHQHHMSYQGDSHVFGEKVLRNRTVVTVHQYLVKTSPTVIEQVANYIVSELLIAAKNTVANFVRPIAYQWHSQEPHMVACANLIL